MATKHFNNGIQGRSECCKRDEIVPHHLGKSLASLMPMSSRLHANID